MTKKKKVKKEYIDLKIWQIIVIWILVIGVTILLYNLFLNNGKVLAIVGLIHASIGFLILSWNIFFPKIYTSSKQEENLEILTLLEGPKDLKYFYDNWDKIKKEESIKKLFILTEYLIVNNIKNRIRAKSLRRICWLGTGIIVIGFAVDIISIYNSFN